MSPTLGLSEPRAPGPLPAGRGRWRITLHSRVFDTTTHSSVTGLAEFVDARSRVLDLAWNTSAQLSFTVDGQSQAAAMATELTTDVMAWRYDEAQGKDILMFRGPITQSQDTLDEQSHVVNFVAHDYLSLLTRRYVTSPTGVTWTNLDQDTIVANLLGVAVHPMAGSGADVFYPGSQLPLLPQRCNPDGTGRSALSGQVRVRTYLGGQEIGAAINDLANVINGFDYDVDPAADTTGVDWLRVFYPSQGVLRSDMAFIYGSTVSGLTRSVNASDYANYVRELGNNGQSDPTQAQVYAECWSAEANNVTTDPVGLWMTSANAADVSQGQTLIEQAGGSGLVTTLNGGALGINGVLQPSYTLTLRPGAYKLGYPNMGDTVPLIINSGRLDVNTAVRVLGLTFTVGDDGQEDVGVTLGRPVVTLAHLFSSSGRDIDALARR